MKLNSNQYKETFEFFNFVHNMAARDMIFHIESH
jgi:hypothetical protein